MHFQPRQSSRDTGRRIRIKDANLDAVGLLPLAASFSAVGRLRANYAEAKDSFVTTGSVNVIDSERSKRSIHYKLGAGLQQILPIILYARRSRALPNR